MLWGLSFEDGHNCGGVWRYLARGAAAFGAGAAAAGGRARRQLQVGLRLCECIARGRLPLLPLCSPLRRSQLLRNMFTLGCSSKNIKPVNAHANQL